MKKILVVNMNWIGDVIFSSPIFPALQQAYPQAFIACMAVPRVQSVVESIPGVDEVIIFDEQGKHKGVMGKIKLVMELRSRHFDIAFLLHRSITRALLVFFAGIPQRVGYVTKNRAVLLTHIVKPQARTIHRSDEYLRVVESFGVPVVDRSTRLVVREETKRAVDVILEKEGIGGQEKITVVHVGANWELKRWPAENFTRLIKTLMEQGVNVVIPGTPEDIPLIQRVIATLNNKPVVLAGKINLKHLMALMQRAQFVVSSDSGPLHLAQAVGANVIGLYGPTRPETTGLRGWGQGMILHKEVGCNAQSCYYLQCPDNICMQAVSVPEVLDAVRQIQSA
ncbi:MAG: lipopolysaccharide heptosyltransferase II [Candidatus Omnitrophota bacterium]|nr:lipopolysaccharide heptosyltransferase II [Candidatus Omnitrophota bacterium]